MWRKQRTEMDDRQGEPGLQQPTESALLRLEGWPSVAEYGVLPPGSTPCWPSRHIDDASPGNMRFPAGSCLWLSCKPELVRRRSTAEAEPRHWKNVVSLLKYTSRKIKHGCATLIREFKFRLNAVYTACRFFEGLRRPSTWKSFSLSLSTYTSLLLPLGSVGIRKKPSLST